MDGRILLDNILAGKTAMGRDLSSSKDSRITFTANDATRMTLYAALDLTSRMFGDITAHDEAFTAFARKMVFFVRRSGVRQEQPSFLTRVGHAADAACMRMEVLSTKIGFAALVDRGLALKAETATAPHATPEGRKPLTRDQEIDCMRRKAKPPLPRVYWQSDDETLTLYELTHPFHIWEEGLRLNNCLARVAPCHPSSRVMGTESPDRLQDLGYWELVEDGKLRLFSLRREKATAVTFSLKGSAVREFTMHLPNAPEIWSAFADIVDILEDDLGPVLYELNHVPPAVNMLLWNVFIERARRGRRHFPPTSPLSPDPDPDVWRRRA